MAELIRLKGAGSIWQGPDDPRLPLDMRYKKENGVTVLRTREERERLWNAFIERWKVIEQCSICHEDLVQEELTVHKLTHLPEIVMPLARMIVRLPLKDRLNLINAFLS